MAARSAHILLVLGLLPASAAATSLAHMNTRTLTRSSNEIVIGTVERVESRWSEGRTQIFTDVTLRVTRSLKGAPVELLTLTQLGGEVDGVKVSVHAAPTFVPGQEALVFVWRDRKGRAQVNGLAQGKFDIRVGPGGGRQVQRTAPGFAIRDVRTLGKAGAGRPAPRIALDDLVAEIGKALAEEPR